MTILLYRNYNHQRRSNMADSPFRPFKMTPILIFFLISLNAFGGPLNENTSPNMSEIQSSLLKTRILKKYEGVDPKLSSMHPDSLEWRKRSLMNGPYQDVQGRNRDLETLRYCLLDPSISGLQCQKIEELVSERESNRQSIQRHDTVLKKAGIGPGKTSPMEAQKALRLKDRLISKNNELQETLSALFLNYRTPRAPVAPIKTQNQTVPEETTKATTHLISELDLIDFFDAPPHTGQNPAGSTDKSTQSQSSRFSKLFHWGSKSNTGSDDSQSSAGSAR